MFSPERFPRTQNSAVVSGTWWGPLITADATIHTKGAWVSLIASTSFDAYLAAVTVSETQTNATDTSMLVDIGYDPAAGTSYTVEIPNLLCFGIPAGAYRTFYLPVSIPKGSQVAARCQALITVDTARVGITLTGGKNRSNPFPHRGVIKDYGTDLATSGGTAMASATTDVKGAWTQLGADTTRRHSGLTVACAPGDNTINGTRFNVDVGIDPAGGTTYGVVIPDMAVTLNSTEGGYMVDPFTALLAIDIPAGAAIAARAAAATANTQPDLEVAVYAF